MAIVSKQFLSASSNGKVISITATAAASAVSVHVPTTGGAGNFDEVWLWAYNESTGNILFSVQWGATGNANTVRKTLQNRSLSNGGPQLIIPGWVVSGTGNTVSAFAASGSNISVMGYVNRITS